MNQKENKENIIAAAATFLAALIILLFLFFGSMRYDRELLAQSSIPEPEEEEELFIEPEIMELGEPDAVNHDSPAPQMQGEPEPDVRDNTKLVVPGDNPKPAPPTPKLVTTDKESPVKATSPSATDEEKQKVTSTVAKGFSGRNGAENGSVGASGAGGDGVGISGSANGRKFKGCPTPQVELRHKTIVKVNVTIDASGKVISAKATGSADASIRRKCEQAAMGARWSEKKGEGESHGSITFTITPR